MFDALQFICIEFIISPNNRGNVKTLIGYDSGIITNKWESENERAKLESHYRGENLVRVSDDKYRCFDDGVGYNVHRYVYVSMRPYGY